MSFKACKLRKLSSSDDDDDVVGDPPSSSQHHRDVNKDDEEEEVDFMSDEFLVECTKDDVRPGLLMKHSDKRRHELMKKQSEANKHTKAVNKSVKQLEEENREKVLNTEISSDNIGYQLLQKMGYKAGSSIGKDAESQNALKEPIPIVLKRNRQGLGGKTKAEEKKQKINEWKEHLEQLSDPNEYRSRIQLNKLNQQTMKDLRKAQSCCQTLDLREDIIEPKQSWFWPEVPKKPNEDEEEFESELKEDSEVDEEVEEIPVNEKLIQIVNYLREQYFYCIWCGSAYDNAEDLSQNCPGLTKDEH